jgi:hypothetical protein
MEVRTGSIAFGRSRTATQDENFAGNVAQSGAEFGFSPRDDHHLGEVDIKVDANVLGTIVRVTATLAPRPTSTRRPSSRPSTSTYCYVPGTSPQACL